MLSHARPAAENLHQRRSESPLTFLPYFRDDAAPPAPIRFRAFLSATLSNTPEPGLRAAALWMAEALLAKQETYTTIDTVAPPARQWRLLKRKTHHRIVLATPTNERRGLADI